MATYYVSSVDGSNSDNGTTWALAVATLKYAVETLAATGGPHTILVDSAHSESLSADTTITAAQDLRIISVNRSGGDAPLAGAVIGTQATNYSVTMAGAFDVYVYGIKFQTGTNTSVGKSVVLDGTDGQHIEYEECDFFVNSTASGRVQIGSSGAAQNRYVRLKSCRARFTNASQGFSVGAGFIEIENLTIVDTGGTALTSTFLTGVSSQAAGAMLSAEGCDFSKNGSGTLVADFAGGGLASYKFTSCRLGSGMTLMAAPTTVLNKGQTTVLAFNCASGDTHINFYHGDAFGETVASTAYWADDTQPSGNNVSWKIVTRASNCSFYTPYVSPWFDKYNSNITTAITPYIEGLRVGSTTVIQDDEVWAEFSYQGTSGYPQAVFANDRMALLGTAANQTSTKAYSDWSGSPTDTANTDSTFKLAAPSSFTPAEIGDLSARIVVGEPGLTIYIDPVIRT